MGMNFKCIATRAMNHLVTNAQVLALCTPTQIYLTSGAVHDDTDC